MRIALVQAARIVGRWYDYVTDPGRRRFMRRVGWHLVLAVAGATGIALVGSYGTVATAATSTITPAYAQATTAGNLVTALVTAGGNSTSAPVVTASSGWNKAVGTELQNVGVGIFYKQNCGAGEAAPTFTCTNAVKMEAALSEWSGADSVTPLDKTGTNQTIANPFVITASAADGQSGNLVLALSSWRGSLTMTFSDSFNNGASINNNSNDGGTSAGRHYDHASWGITTGNGSADSDTITLGGTAQTSCVGAIASFKPSAGGGPAPEPGLFTSAGHPGPRPF